MAELVPTGPGFFGTTGTCCRRRQSSHSPASTAKLVRPEGLAPLQPDKRQSHPYRPAQRAWRRLATTPCVKVRRAPPKRSTGLCRFPASAGLRRRPAARGIHARAQGHQTDRAVHRWGLGVASGTRRWRKVDVRRYACSSKRHYLAVCTGGIRWRKSCR